MRKTFKSMVAFVFVLAVFASLTGIAVSAESNNKAVLTVDEKVYEAAVGDEVVYTVRLEVRGGVDSIAASVHYNPEVLALVQEPADVCAPNLADSSIITNSPIKHAVYVNATAMYNSFDFSANQILVAMRFKVIAEGTSDFSIFFTQLDGPNHEVYAKDGEFYNDSVIITSSISGLSEERYLKISYENQTCTVKAGDVVTFTVYAQAPEAISEVMAGIKFDNSRLELLENTLKERYPNLWVGNDEYAGRSQQFAGSPINTDFHSDDPVILAKLRFLVKGEGSTELDIFYDFLSKTGISYTGVEDGDIKLTAEFTVDDKESADGLLIGDADGDGKLNVKDATAIQKHAAKVSMLSESALNCADVNADGKVNVRDATAVQKYLARIDTGYPIGEKQPRV